MSPGITSSQPFHFPMSTMYEFARGARGNRFPYVDRLIEQLGGQDWLSSMINASKFEYTYGRDMYEKDYAVGGHMLSALTTLSYAVEVEFILGWGDRWVCNIKRDVDEYLVVLRQCPLTRASHATHRTFCHSADYLKNWLEIHTGLALSF